jgi:hypothetical protein
MPDRFAFRLETGWLLGPGGRIDLKTSTAAAVGEELKPETARAAYETQGDAAALPATRLGFDLL